jgi:hypothetical protein
MTVPVPAFLVSPVKLITSMPFRRTLATPIVSEMVASTST